MRASLAVVAAVAFVGTLSPRSVARGEPAPGADVERAARELDDPSWEVRRAATAALLLDGRAALAEIADDSGPAPLERLERWLKAVEERLASGSPTAAGRARAVLAVVEEEASTEAVKRSAVLLRARLRRLLPLATVDSPEDADFEEGVFDAARGDRFDAARNARTALETLLPEARPLLLATVSGSRDPAAIAGALSVLSGDDGTGPDDEVTAAIVTRFAADPAVVDGVLRFVTPGSAPAATTVVALSLALSGHPVEATRFDRDGELAAPLRRRLAERGDADLTTGSFLDEVSEGHATTADAEGAARRLAELGLPHFARLAARRALFLDATNEGARRVLVDADVALGLLDTARKDASAATPVPLGTATGDAPATRALDEALRAGRFADRLAWRKEVGTTHLFGTPPVAIGDGVVACGRTDGRVMLLDPATGDERASVRTAPVARDPRDGFGARVPRGLAIAKGRLAALSARGRLSLWALDKPDAPLSEAPGPFDFVAAGPDGTFWIASAGRRIHRVAPGATAPEAVAAVPFSPNVVPAALHVLSDGSLVLHTGTSLERIEPASGAVSEILAGVAGMASAPYGDAVLFGLGGTWGTIRAGRLSRGGQAPDDGEIVGVAGDPAAGIVYLTLPSETVAVRATDGEVLWRRGVEGSGNPVLGPGLLVVPAGSGGDDGGGNGRADRTLFALTTSRPPSDLFSEATIARVLVAATAAVREGHVDIGVLMLDPVRDWVGDGRPAFDAAVSAARSKADPDARKDDGEDEPAPEPVPVPPPAPPEPAPVAPPAPKPGAGR